MYNYFTKVKGLDNLLWVYSPAASGGKSYSWAYPGNQYVHIVAATAYNDSLSVSCYSEMASFKKPMAMAEYGGTDHAVPQVNGSFDNRKFIQVIQSTYPKFAYFVCWHNWDNGGGNFVYHSIDRNRYANEMMNDRNAITRDKLNWASY